MPLRPVPSFQSHEEWLTWFEAELAAALPVGWTSFRSVRNLRSTRVSWRVEPPQDGVPRLDFILEPSADWDAIVVFCGNSDGGPGGVHWSAPSARVIQRESLALAELREVLRWVFAHCEPNEYGLT